MDAGCGRIAGAEQDDGSGQAVMPFAEGLVDFGRSVDGVRCEGKVVQDDPGDGEPVAATQLSGHECLVDFVPESREAGPEPGLVALHDHRARHFRCLEIGQAFAPGGHIYGGFGHIPSRVWAPTSCRTFRPTVMASTGSDSEAAPGRTRAARRAAAVRAGEGSEARKARNSVSSSRGRAEPGGRRWRESSRPGVGSVPREGRVHGTCHSLVP